METLIEEKKQKGYTCIPNPTGDGILCYKDRDELSLTMLNIKRCPNDFTKLEHRLFSSKAKCPECGFTVSGVGWFY